MVGVLVGFGVRVDAIVFPSAPGAAWLDREVGAMTTFNMQTFASGKPGAAPAASAFSPFGNVSLPDSWMEATVAFGAQYNVFVADHFSGFNLWYSDAWSGSGVAEYDLRAANFGRDILSDFVASAASAGVAKGLFYSVHENWQWGVGEYVTPNASEQQRFNAFNARQLTALLNGSYGNATAPWSEVWFDAGVLTAVAPQIGPVVRKFAPTAMCHSCGNFSGAGMGLRWMGNEEAVMPLPNWNAVQGQAYCGSSPAPNNNDYKGDENGTLFCPASCDTPLREHYWFWKPNTEHTIKSVSTLVTNYLTSVGRGCNLILNIAPDTTGLVPASDMAQYHQFGAAIALLTSKPLQIASNPPLTASHTSHSSPPLLTATIPIPATPATKNLTVVVMEDLVGFGQTIADHSVLLHFQDQSSYTLAQNATTIGHKRIYISQSPATNSNPNPPPSNKTITAVSVLIHRLAFSTPQPPLSLRQIAVYDTAPLDEFLKQTQQQ